MPSIFDLVTSAEITAYWEMKTQDRAPYLGEELFPNEQQLSLEIRDIRGAKGLPVVLKPSAFDVAAIPRPRIGFDALRAQMPFFKESKYIDEELRQELNKVIDSNNTVFIDTIMRSIFDDEVELIEGAAAQRERMRMMALTTGQILIEGNGQLYEYDYMMPEEHKVTATTGWDDENADIIGDIRNGIEKISEDTGEDVARAVTSSKVLGLMRKNKAIRQTINSDTQPDAYISDDKLRQFLMDEFNLDVVTNNKKYVDEQGKTQRYVPEDVFVMFPAGNLGKTKFGMTPEQSDLLSSPTVANVTITDTGVAVTTSKKIDPVQVDTKVTQICLPSFPMAESVYIVDVNFAE